MPVCVGLIMLAAHFCQSPLIKGQVYFNNDECKAACRLCVISTKWRLIGLLSIFCNCPMLSQPKSAMKPRRLFLRISLLTCQQKSNPFDETVPLKFSGLLFKTCSSWLKPPTTPCQNWSTVKCGYSYSTALRLNVVYIFMRLFILDEI